MNAIMLLPAVRGLLATEEGLPRLVKVADDSGAAKIALPADLSAPQAELVAELRRQIPEGTQRVSLGDLGTWQAVWSDGTGRAAGKIALVTGAAQGFGLQIATDLARQGAWVALADINANGVEAAAKTLNDECGEGTAVGIVVNVADAESQKAAVETVVSAFGGLDLLVSNAGVLRAGSVKTISVKDIDFVTSVNYKGYFLAVQAVAPVMALERAACPSRWFDIIQINSKSGLVGSNKNGAYAGSKFGGIGLTQSFALELVADGIKVNSICPGNFYDGPLWSDPQRGLFKQYLDTGKVPGAKTFADVKAFYEAKVPMRRGCTTPDVMKAIYYLMEQVYETGQAIPVTGGQVMLS